MVLHSPSSPWGGESHSSSDRWSGQCHPDQAQDQAPQDPHPTPQSTPGPGTSVSDGKNHIYHVIISVLSELIGPVLPPSPAQSILARHRSRTWAAAAGKEPGEREPGEASAGPFSCAQEPPWEPWSLALALLSSSGCDGIVPTREGRAQPHPPAGSCRPIWPMLTSTATRSTSD